MAGVKKRARSAGNTTIAQTSRLLSLPAELRNHIYSEVAQHVDTISVREDCLLYAPSMSLVSRQVRREYEQVYRDESPKHATILHMHFYSINFVCSLATVQRIRDHVEHKPARRCYPIHHVRLTNVFDYYLYDLRQLVEGRALVPRQPWWSDDLEKRLLIEWDPKGFDVDSLKKAVEKMDWLYWHWEDSPPCWVPFKQATQEAIERYEAEALERTKKRRRRGIEQFRVTSRSRSGSSPRKRRKVATQMED